MIIAYSKISNGKRYFGFMSLRTGGNLTINGYGSFRDFQDLVDELGPNREPELNYLRKLAPAWCFEEK